MIASFHKSSILLRRIRCGFDICGIMSQSQVPKSKTQQNNVMKPLILIDWHNPKSNYRRRKLKYCNNLISIWCVSIHFTSQFALIRSLILQQKNRFIERKHRELCKKQTESIIWRFLAMRNGNEYMTKALRLPVELHLHLDANHSSIVLIVRKIIIDSLMTYK